MRTYDTYETGVNQGRPAPGVDGGSSQAVDGGSSQAVDAWRLRAGALAVAALAGWAAAVAGLLLFPPSSIALAALATLATAAWRRHRRALDAIARATARTAVPEGW
jgi:hypothetical protein